MLALLSPRLSARPLTAGQATFELVPDDPAEAFFLPEPSPPDDDPLDEDEEDEDSEPLLDPDSAFLPESLPESELEELSLLALPLDEPEPVLLRLSVR